MLASLTWYGSLGVGAAVPMGKRKKNGRTGARRTRDANPSRMHLADRRQSQRAQSPARAHRARQSHSRRQDTPPGEGGHRWEQHRPSLGVGPGSAGSGSKHAGSMSCFRFPPPLGSDCLPVGSARSIPPERSALTSAIPNSDSITRIRTHDHFLVFRWHKACHFRRRRSVRERLPCQARGFPPPLQPGKGCGTCISTLS